MLEEGRTAIEADAAAIRHTQGESLVEQKPQSLTMGGAVEAVALLVMLKGKGNVGTVKGAFVGRGSSSGTTGGESSSGTLSC